MIGEEQGTNHAEALWATVRTLIPSGRKPWKAFEHRSDMIQFTFLEDHSGCDTGRNVGEQGQEESSSITDTAPIQGRHDGGILPIRNPEHRG